MTGEKKFKKCNLFEIIHPIDKKELDKYYCWHHDNMESECEYASCPRNYPTWFFF